MSTPNSFITPTTTRLNLSNGRWADVKTELDVADQRKMDVLAMHPVRLPDGSVVDRTDWGLYEILRTHMWVTGWNFCGEDGHERPYSLDAIKALDPDVFNELNNRVFDHIMNSLAEKKRRRSVRQQEKSPEAESSAAATST